MSTEDKQYKVRLTSCELDPQGILWSLVRTSSPGYGDHIHITSSSIIIIGKWEDSEVYDRCGLFPGRYHIAK